MKTSERHQLKSNEVAEQLARVGGWASASGKQLAWLAAAGLLLLVVIGAIWAWRQGTQERAGAALAAAMTIADSPIVRPDSDRPPTPDSFSSEQVRSEAAVKKYQEVIQQYPNTEAASTARFEAAALLASLGRHGEAEQYFREVADGGGGIHARMARMGLAELQARAGKYDEAIATYRDLAARQDHELPVDGLLMQLGRVYEQAGKRAEALQTYERILSEFPSSIYSGEARRAADTLKAGTAS